MEDQFKAFSKRINEFNKRDRLALPSMEKTRALTELLVRTLFPLRENCPLDADGTAGELVACATGLRDLLQDMAASLPQDPEAVSSAFFSELPEVFEQLISDAEALARFDPAASCEEEVILSYPGFFCISVYRMAHILYGLDVPLLPRMMSEFAHSQTGIDIHPGARIASPFFIDHGTGIVIGETAEIGAHVRIYQGVTLGALTVEKSMAETKRHPTIGDHVVIYAGSTILGGDTHIGHHTVVGGNTWITESVEPHSLVYRNHRVVVKGSR